jgi:metallo-beta-lactamase family protein
VRDGFRGRVYATPGTTELSSIILPDSGYLLEEEAAYARHKKSSRRDAPLPLYTAEDAVRSLDSFEERNFDEPILLGGGVTATFVPAGHILGASQVLLDVDGTRVHFTGDLGRPGDPLMQKPRRWALWMCWWRSRPMATGFTPILILRWSSARWSRGW